MINTTVLELNAASDVTFRKNGEAGSEYATLLGIQNVYLGKDRTSKLPLSILLQENCAAYARKAGLGKGRRFLVHGKLTYSEEHQSYTLKADQITVFPLSKSNAAGDDDPVAQGADVSGSGLEARSKKTTKTNPK